MIVHTQVGALRVKFDALGNVCTLDFVSDCTLQSTQNRDSNIVTDSRKEKRVAAEIAGYFAGKRKKFTIPFAVAGSSFSLRVWNALRCIDYGKRVSYSDVASRIDAPRATRAVAHAIATNPIPIIIPCHRVVRKDGQIGEYALHTLGKSGRVIKGYLLNLESK